MDVGTTIVVKIVPMSNNNSSMMISEHCTALNSFYTVSDGQSGEYQGVFNTIEDEQESKAGFIKLTAFILRSGTLTVHPRITCGSKYEYPITCLGQSNDQVCQKIVKPLPATTLKVMVVRDHETQKNLTILASSNLDLVNVDDVSLFFQQGENLSFDVIAVDVLGNHVKDYDLSDVTANFYFGKSKLKLTAIHMPGVIHFQA